MSGLVDIFVRSALIDNMVFAYFLGMCSYLAVSKNVKTAFGLGIAVCFVLAVTVPVNYLLDKYFLQAGALAWISPELSGLNLSFLSLILFIAVIAPMMRRIMFTVLVVQLVLIVMVRLSPSSAKPISTVSSR